MIERVVKRNGEIEEFSAEKLNKWAEYATEQGGNWSEIAQKTFKRLPQVASTQDIHQTMIDVCLSKQTIEYSRVAARLEMAEIKKCMNYILGIDPDTDTFQEIMSTLEDLNVWDSSVLPDYNPVWEDWYNGLKNTHMEFWRVKQWSDKYAQRIADNCIETPVIGYMGIALALFGDSDKAYGFAEALTLGKISLPTPALNGLRNGDFDTISCCVISAEDTTESIGVANWIAYRMTAKKAGIGIEYTTRSRGDSVKSGRVKHLGKHPIYKVLDREVKVLTQITRGGNATVTVLAVDPEIEEILLWKSQRKDLETRIDKLDYEFGYNQAFFDAVVLDSDWHLFSLADAPEIYDCFYTATTDEYNSVVHKLLAKSVKHVTVKARDLLKTFLTVRQETGRFYDHNLTRTNTHTPFIDVIRQSNLCEEICLPTKGYKSMEDLYSPYSVGETAFCSLSAINVANTSLEEYERVAALCLEAVDIMIDNAPMMAKSMKESIMRRRSVGIGITGLASALYKNGLDYDGSKKSLSFVQTLAEHHYYYLLKASQELAERDGVYVGGIDTNWIPVDTSINESITGLDWESLRGKGRKHSVLAAHMPTESSSLLCGSSNSLYPVRKKVIHKRSRKGLVQYICTEFDEGQYKTAWEVDNITLSKYYGRIQDFTDQAISADFYVDPKKWEGEKIPMSVLMKEWVAHAKLGNKTKYYLNTKDDNGGSFQDQKRDKENQAVLDGVVKPQQEVIDGMVVEVEEDGCQGGCKL